MCSIYFLFVCIHIPELQYPCSMSWRKSSLHRLSQVSCGMVTLLPRWTVCRYCDVPPCQGPNFLLRNAGKLARMGIPSGDMGQPPVVATAMIRFSWKPRAETTTEGHLISQGQVIIYTYLPSSSSTSLLLLFYYDCMDVPPLPNTPTGDPREPKYQRPHR